MKNKRLSAKNLFTRKELSGIQTDFAAQVGAEFNLERGKAGSENKLPIGTAIQAQNAENTMQSRIAQAEKTFIRKKKLDCVEW